MNKLVEVKKVSEKKGRGVIAKRHLKKGTLIDVAHIILIPNHDYDIIQDTILYDYIFEWDDPEYKGEYKAVIPLSIAQLINHSYEPNVRYEYNYKKKTITFITMKEIQKGEELYVNYNGRTDDKSPVWFEVE